MKLLSMLLVLMMCIPMPAGAEELTLVFCGDWDHIRKENYQEEMRELFETTYPRLYARWGTEDSPTTIFYRADAEEKTNVAYSYGQNVVVAVDYANAEPHDLGFFSHELTHCIQAYSGKLNYGSDAWWTENMANYGGFRYYHWADVSQMEPSSTNPEDWMDWGYQPYGNCQWFFAYMDARYPTVMDEQGNLSYGLIDSIHRLICENAGEELDDDPYLPETPINQLVCAMTGYETIEALRLRFVEELREGSWSFAGFSGYPDNFLTENLENVRNPDYPAWEPAIHRSGAAEAMEAIVEGENLCLNASVVEASGFVNEYEAPELLIDGDFYTKWCSTQMHVSNMKYSMDGTRQWIVLDLGEEKEFNTYTIVNTKTVEPVYGNMVEWELLVSTDGENWRSVDYQTGCDRDMVSFDIGMQKARYLLLRAYRPDDGQVDTIRLYELMLFKR